MTPPQDGHAEPEILNLDLEDEAATDALGAALATFLKPGQLLALSGGLGAGKTRLARALIRTLAKDPHLDVPSPSFALVQPYELAGGHVLHADLYRLEAEIDVEELGLFDDPLAIVLVEWAERAPALLHEADLVLVLEVPAGGHGRVVRAHSPRASFALAALAAALDNSPG